MQDLKKWVMESEKQRERESASRNYPLIGFRRPGEKRAEMRRPRRMMRPLRLSRPLSLKALKRLSPAPVDISQSKGVVRLS